MARLNFTNSKDGKKRVTLRVEHRMEKDDLARALAVEVNRSEPFDDLPEEMSEAEVMRRIRELLQNSGFDATWGEDVDETFTEWATRQIERILP
jgi:hypothetical protein